MASDPDRLLNRLVVAALTVFITVVMLLAALVVRQIWLQQRMVELSSDLQVNLEDLGETTERIQSELSEIRTAADDPENVENWEGITELLDDVSQQLDSLGENIGEVALVAEPPGEVAPPPAGDDEDDLSAVQTPVDQVFTIFAALAGAAAIVIAILLGLAVRVRQGT